MTESAAILYDMGCTYEQVTRSLKKCVVRYSRGMLEAGTAYPSGAPEFTPGF